MIDSSGQWRVPATLAMSSSTSDALEQPQPTETEHRPCRPFKFSSSHTDNGRAGGGGINILNLLYLKYSELSIWNLVYISQLKESPFELHSTCTTATPGQWRPRWTGQFQFQQDAWSFSPCAMLFRTYCVNFLGFSSDAPAYLPSYAEHRVIFH